MMAHVREGERVRTACEHMFVAARGQGTRRGAAESTASLRECAKHGVVEFHLYAGSRGRKVWRCKRCAAEAVTRRHRKLKRLLVEACGGRCVVCGYSRAIRNLVFHHVDKADKSFEMSMARGKSEAAYRAEMAKCVLVCANCHGEIEEGLIPSPPPGARFVLK